MKKIKLLIICMLGCIQTSTTAEDYSKMSSNQLDEALVEAVKKGCYQEVQKLVHAGANGNQKMTYTKRNYDDYDSKITCTLLEYAAKQGYVDIVKELVLKAENDEINTALVLAAEEGHTSVVKELIQASDAKVGVLSHIKCLFIPSEKCKICSNKKYRNIALINAAKSFPGITVNPSSGKRHRTALKDHLNVIKELIKMGANVNYTDDFGDTALIAIAKCSLYTQAQKNDRQEIIKNLLQAKANVNHANKRHDTALIRAIRNHDFDVVQILLNFPEVDINYTDDKGDTPLIIALQSVRSTYISGNNEQYNECLNSQKIVEAILQIPGIDFHHANKKGETAIMLLEKLKNR